MNLPIVSGVVCVIITGIITAGVIITILLCVYLRVQRRKSALGVYYNEHIIGDYYC